MLRTVIDNDHGAAMLAGEVIRRAILDVVQPTKVGKGALDPLAFLAALGFGEDDTRAIWQAKDPTQVMQDVYSRRRKSA